MVLPELSGVPGLMVAPALPNHCIDLLHMYPYLLTSMASNNPDINSEY
jgi:hypothetical protein